MFTIMLHVANGEPIKCEVDELPKPTDNCVVAKNPRMKSEKELNWVDEGVQTVVVPMHRLNYIQVYPDGDEALDFPLTYRD